MTTEVTPHDFALAGRRIVDADVSVGEKYVALAKLGVEGRAVRFAPEALWLAVRAFLTGEPELLPPGPDPVNAKLRGLRRQGYQRCPACSRPLPSEAALDEWDRRARDGLRVAMVRSGRA